MTIAATAHLRRRSPHIITGRTQMMNKRHDRLAWVGATVLLACTTTQTNHSTTAGNNANRESFGRTPLPSLEQVQSIARRPVSIPRAEIPPTSIATWELLGPLPTGLEAANTANTLNAAEPIEAALSALVANRTVTPSDTMRCYAREFARFMAINNRAPARTLQQFMGAACRVHTRRLASVIFTSTIEANAPAAQLNTELARLVTTQMRDFASSAEGHLGIASFREGTRVAIVALAGVPDLRLEAESPAQDGSVLVRGEVVGARPEDTLYVAANQPDGGAKLCVFEPGSVSPRFAVRCAVPRTGAPSIVSISRIPAGSFLGRDVGEALIGGAEPARRWQLAQYPEVRWSDEQQTRAQLGRIMNSIRAAGGRQPLEFAPEAESTACSLSGHMHAALVSDAARDMGEEATLGMMAGFGVPRMVRSGLVGASVSGSLDATVVLSDALASPGARLTLMDPLARYGALCPVHADNGFVGLSYVTWRIVDETTMHDTGPILSRIQEERARRGVPPMQQWEGPPRTAAAAIRAIDTGARTPTEALNDSMAPALEEVGTAAAQGVQARMFSSFSTGSAVLPVPDGLLAPSMTLAHIASTWYRPPGSPWAIQLFLVYAPGTGGQPRTN